MDPATELELRADEPVLSFYVAGKPQTAGSKSAVPMGKRWGVIEAGNSKTRAAKTAWRADLRAAAAQAMESGDWSVPEPARALRMNLVIARRRPSGHLGTGKNAGVIKDRFRDARPVARPDSIKMTRAIEDALTSVAYHDDSVICSHSIEKVFSDQIGRSVHDEGVHLTIALI